ncbi:hypothetical protein EON62_00190 [archaeon]|nr:MAG: hypothetical protein EON62_00190 [archaeon]
MAAALAAAAACVSVGYATATPPPPGSLPSPAWHATKSGLATMDNRAAHTSFYNLIPAHSLELKDVTYTQLYMNWPVFDGFQVAPGTPFYSVYHYFKLDYTGSTAGQGFRVRVRAAPVHPVCAPDLGVGRVRGSRARMYLVDWLCVPLRSAPHL